MPCPQIWARQPPARASRWRCRLRPGMLVAEIGCFKREGSEVWRQAWWDLMGFGTWGCTSDSEVLWRVEKVLPGLAPRPPDGLPRWQHGSRPVAAAGAVELLYGSLFPREEKGYHRHLQNKRTYSAYSQAKRSTDNTTRHPQGFPPLSAPAVTPKLHSLHRHLKEECCEQGAERHAHEETMILRAFGAWCSMTGFGVWVWFRGTRFIFPDAGMRGCQALRCCGVDDDPSCELVAVSGL